MQKHSLVPEDEPIEVQLDRYRRITDTLIRRVEGDHVRTANAFSLFQRATALEAEVRSRTRDLNETLSALNRANEKLEAASVIAAEANRAKSRFLAAASHDVMQPLNAAKLFIDSLRLSALDPAQQRMLHQLESAFGSVEAILGALSDISRLDTSAIRPDVGSFPVARLLDRIADEFGPLAGARNVRFDFVPCGAWVLSDLTYLRQIVQNLVSNAIRYCEGGRVLLGCRHRGDTLRIEVHDTGPGIAEADLPLIFEEFRRLRPGNGGDGEGLGLGLAIVERACRLLDHRLDLRSEVGRGSVFAVDVPLTYTELDTAADETDDTLIALIVTPDERLAAHVASLLDGWQMGALTAGSVNEARSLVGQIGVVPDVLMLDDAFVSETPVFEGCTTLFLQHSHRGDTPADGLQIEVPILPHRLRASLEYARGRGKRR